MPKAKKSSITITEAHPGDLLPNPWNPNHLTPEGEKKLEASIARHGFFRPIIVREIEEGLQIIGGENRAAAAERLGYDRVPIINLGVIDDIKAKEIGLIDNARYGADDATELSSLLKELGDLAEIQTFMPFNDEDVTAIFAGASINLDDLELDNEFDLNAEETKTDEPKPERVPKTHTIMRFKVALADAENIARRIAETRVAQGFTASDELTNAGDALVYMLLSQRDV